MEKKPDNKRAILAFTFLVIIGLVIGFLIKRVHIGLLIGLSLGFLASGMIRRRKLPNSR